MKQILNLASAAAVLLASSAASAAPVIYFGENLAPAGGVSGAPVTARNSFLAQLSGVSTESFEGFNQSDKPSSLNFNGSAGAITASFAPSSGFICASNGCSGSGRYATDGTRYFDVSSTFTATFSTAVAAFGFYGTDIGDISGSLTVELLRASGNTMLVVPNTINAPNASLLFYGIIDQANPFTGIRFGNTAAGSDFFGFDQLTVGDVQQVVPSIPEPATWMMMLMGFGLIGAAMRRKRQNVQVSFG